MFVVAGRRGRRPLQAYAVNILESKPPDRKTAGFPSILCLIEFSNNSLTFSQVVLKSSVWGLLSNFQYLLVYSPSLLYTKK